MSPYHERWSELPRDFKRGVKRLLGPENKARKYLQGLINSSGIAILTNSDGDIVDVEPASNLPEGVLEDSKKETSNWHYVGGLSDQQRIAEKTFRKHGDRTIEDAELPGGYSGSPYRGKHRSDLKGAGSKHIYNYGMHIPLRFRRK